MSAENIFKCLIFNASALLQCQYPVHSGSIFLIQSMFDFYVLKKYTKAMILVQGKPIKNGIVQQYINLSEALV
jgi:hypothetical protein